MRWGLALLLAGTAWAQQLDLSRLDGLAAKAKESTNISLDSDKIRMLSGFVDENAARGVLTDLRGINVRSFEFDNSGAYSQSDLDSIRSQLKGPNWVRVVDVRGRDETAEVWFYSEGGKPGGLTVIAAEPRELAVVNVVGPINMSSLMRLAGMLGIPNLPGSLMQPGSPNKTSPRAKPSSSPAAPPAPPPAPKKEE